MQSNAKDAINIAKLSDEVAALGEVSRGWLQVCGVINTGIKVQSYAPEAIASSSVHSVGPDAEMHPEPASHSFVDNANITSSQEPDCIPCLQLHINRSSRPVSIASYPVSWKTHRVFTE